MLIKPFVEHTHSTQMVMWSPSQTGEFPSVLRFSPTRIPAERKYRCINCFVIVVKINKL